MRKLCSVHNHIWPAENFRLKLLLIYELANKPVIPKHYYVIMERGVSLNINKVSDLVTGEGKQGLNHHFRDLLINNIGSYHQTSLLTYAKNVKC